MKWLNLFHGEICNFLKVYTFIGRTKIPILIGKCFQDGFLLRYAVPSLKGVILATVRKLAKDKPCSESTCIQNLSFILGEWVVISSSSNLPQKVDGSYVNSEEFEYINVNLFFLLQPDNRRAVIYRHPGTLV